jgi:hypothetical protein
MVGDGFTCLLDVLFLLFVGQLGVTSQAVSCNTYGVEASCVCVDGQCRCTRVPVCFSKFEAACCS